MRKSQNWYLPKIYYGEYELDMMPDHNNVFRTSIYYESLRFVNGALDTSKLKFFGTPGHNYTIEWHL